MRLSWSTCFVTGSVKRDSYGLFVLLQEDSATRSVECGTNGLHVLLQGVMNAAPMACVFCYRE